MAGEQEIVAAGGVQQMSQVSDWGRGPPCWVAYSFPTRGPIRPVGEPDTVENQPISRRGTDGRHVGPTCDEMEQFSVRSDERALAAQSKGTV